MSFILSCIKEWNENLMAKEQIYILKNNKQTKR